MVSNIGFDRAWIQYEKNEVSFANSIGRHSTSGHARDSPTPMVHGCRKTPGCPFRHVRMNRVKGRELTCSSESAYAARVAAREETTSTILCGWEGCTQMFPTNTKRQEHWRIFHRFAPKACPEGCAPKSYAPRRAVWRHTWCVDTAAGGPRHVDIQDARETNSTGLPIPDLALWQTALHLQPARTDRHAYRRQPTPAQPTLAQQLPPHLRNL